MKGINIVENVQVGNSFYSTYEKGRHAGESYYTQISIACVNPLCTCGEVAFGLRPVDSSEIPPSGIPSNQGEPGAPYHSGAQPDDNLSADRSGPSDSDLRRQLFPIEFHLDVLRKKATLPASGEKDSLGYSMAKDFARELTDSMWEQLRTYFYAEKSSITRAIKDLDSLEADFSPMQDDIQNESVLVAYYLILPYAESMPFMYEGKKHLAIDQYCVVPRCSCTQVSISFYCEADNSDKMISIGTHYIYDYKKKKWEADDADDDTATARQPMLTSLIRAFERDYPQFRDELKKRHRTLRRLYSNYLERTNQSAAAPVSDEMPKKSFGRVGRNDPCPCGSGRKYKQCCGR